MFKLPEESYKSYLIISMVLSKLHPFKKITYLTNKLFQAQYNHFIKLNIISPGKNIYPHT